MKQMEISYTATPVNAEQNMSLGVLILIAILVNTKTSVSGLFPTHSGGWTDPPCFVRTNVAVRPSTTRPVLRQQRVAGNRWTISLGHRPHYFPDKTNRPRMKPKYPQERPLMWKRSQHWTQMSGHDNGDPLRASTGIRPSLHPVTINSISTALKIRARGRRVDDVMTTSNMTVEFSSVRNKAEWYTKKPLELVLLAGEIAGGALLQRRNSTKIANSMDKSTELFTLLEEQTIAGRVVGVVLRFPDLEKALVERCKGCSWIAKYSEHSSFGVLPDELVYMMDGMSDAEMYVLLDTIDQKILSDPLFALSRAECLLSLFLHEVEAPKLAASNSTVPDNSVIDFIDFDRKKVLLANSRQRN